ncbi:MAG: YcaO-like family protein, partial [Arthrobacter sp.]|nr:YcaO-like family protein [Arthrobacter sp.]
HIHGGRDDLVKIHEHFTDVGPGEKRHEISALRSQVRDEEAPIPFSELMRLAALETSIPGALEALLARLGAAGFPEVYRTVLTTPDDPISVVRVIVPGMEFYKPDFKRVGQGLMNAITKATQESTK